MYVCMLKNNIECEYISSHLLCQFGILYLNKIIFLPFYLLCGKIFFLSHTSRVFVYRLFFAALKLKLNFVVERKKLKKLKRMKLVFLCVFEDNQDFLEQKI